MSKSICSLTKPRQHVGFALRSRKAAEGSTRRAGLGRGGSRSRVESGFFPPGQCVTGWAVIEMTGHQEIDQVVLALSAERVTIIAAIAKTTVTHFKHKVDTNV